MKTTVSSEDDKALGFTTFQFVERKWYFITITHSNYRGPFTRDEAKLYIDGQLRQTIYVKYPHQHSVDFFLKKKTKEKLFNLF